MNVNMEIILIWRWISMNKMKNWMASYQGEWFDLIFSKSFFSDLIWFDWINSHTNTLIVRLKKIRSYNIEDIFRTWSSLNDFWIIFLSFFLQCMCVCVWIHHHHMSSSWHIIVRRPVIVCYSFAIIGFNHFDYIWIISSFLLKSLSMCVCVSVCVYVLHASLSVIFSWIEFENSKNIFFSTYYTL